MATHSIKSGGDYTTISGFESDADTYWGGASDVFHGEIQDNSSYSEIIIINFSETPTSTKFLELSTHADNFPSDGKWSDSLGRMLDNSDTLLTISEDNTYIHHMQLGNSKSSDDCIRVSGSAADEVLISYCIMKATDTTSSQDGVYQSSSGSATQPTYIDNCIFYDMDTAVKASKDNAILYVDHCFTYNVAEAYKGRDTKTGQVINAYNSIGFAVTGEAFDSEWNTHTGSNNIADDTTAETNFTSSYDSVSVVSTSPGSGENVWTVDASVDNFAIEGENAFTVTQNGTNRIGSEPDARQDFTYDITGAERSTTPNIGAFAFGDGIASSGTTHNETVTITHNQAMTAATIMTTNQAATLTHNQALASATIMTTNQAATLTHNQALASAVVMNTDQAATLSHAQQMTALAGLDMDVSTVLALAAQLSVASEVSIESAIAIAMTQALSTSTVMETDQSVSLPITVTAGASTTAIFEGSISIDVDGSIVFAQDTLGAFDVQVSFAMNQGLAASVLAEFHENVTIEQVMQLSTETIATLNDEITINLDTGLAAVSGTDIDASAILTFVATLDSVGAIIQEGQIVTPDGRTLVITFDDRTLRIKFDDRDLKIH